MRTGWRNLGSFRFHLHRIPLCRHMSSFLLHLHIQHFPDIDFPAAYIRWYQYKCLIRFRNFPTSVQNNEIFSWKRFLRDFCFWTEGEPRFARTLKGYFIVTKVVETWRANRILPTVSKITWIFFVFSVIKAIEEN